MYAQNEVETSEKNLEKVFKHIKGNICLLGGWATYQIVNKNFENNTGRKYIGSRDIDIGFHINEDLSEEQLKRSEFYTSICSLEDMGFRLVSFRLVKDFDSETGRELEPEESAKLPMYQLFQLYVDPIVDYIHPRIKQVLGFVPIDEPLLSLVFTNKLCTVSNLFGISVLLPEPHVLLAMKLNSVINRDKEHKRIKDLADIYALLWFSGIDIAQLKAHLLSIYPVEKARKTIHGFAEEEIGKVSATIGISPREIRRVLVELT